MAASLVNTVVNNNISLRLDFAGTVEIKVDAGARNPKDMLRGYRGAYYMGIGLARLGILMSLTLLVKMKRKQCLCAREKSRYNTNTPISL
ncbi:hypothetical protein F5X99DRAFT_425825 [Biscogniauxia marginata]|nr:hypothetical protein F5X99DRAFT_425825 [Biscogniauxia marginata]